ncbi:MAG TPA: formate dehydrogenase accessory sulfurtransferase FdhD [Thermoanaerobaculia bacterium]|jgi:FdhD protein|nr:formate dehydrogenase accessory sulfurtransferase FdhD [Thermoanaerobaculia bacterium]
MAPKVRTGTREARIWRVESGRSRPAPDQVATEEPLEIRLLWSGVEHTVAVTMRTPGADEELAAGFLYAEGVVERPERILGFHRPPEARTGEPEPNIVAVELGDGPDPNLPTLERHFFSSSACGVCGKAGLAALQVRSPGRLPDGPEIDPQLVASLPGRLREAQGLFDATGGLHAAALFDQAGNLLGLREDVGRHNALDKLLGRAFLDGRLPLHDHLVLVSGRTSYEILQKCAVAGVPIVCAVSAPSSLAVELAESFGITLIGFLRGERFNVYAGAERITGVGPRRSVQRGRRGLLPTVV